MAARRRCRSRCGQLGRRARYRCELVARYPGQQEVPRLVVPVRCCESQPDRQPVRVSLDDGRRALHIGTRTSP